MRKLALLLGVLLLFAGIPSQIYAEELAPGVKSAILIEPSTDTVLYEQNADERLHIASVTKIMTMLIILEKVDSGEMSLDDIVTASKNAESYGGSTMYLAEGEQFTVNDMLKGIAVASANDGCVAMSEHIAGNEEAFVEMMNKRAEELGMTNTLFANCNGLDDDIDLSQAYSTARDVAIMSKELMKHPKIYDYTSIWIDYLRDGKFMLANTNKLIHNYKGATGLKTGSTTKAGCCLSATANRDGMDLLAVVLGAETTEIRFSSSQSLLDYGFLNYKVEKVIAKGDPMGQIKVSWGEEKEIPTEAAEDYNVLEKKAEPIEIEKSVNLKKKVHAPVKRGDKLGEITVTENGEETKVIDIIASQDVAKKGFFRILADVLSGIFNG